MTPREKAQDGYRLLKEAILETLEHHPNGMRNCDICDALDLRTDFEGASKDYLVWSILGMMLKDRTVKREGRRYFRAG